MVWGSGRIAVAVAAVVEVVGREWGVPKAAGVARGRFLRLPLGIDLRFAAQRYRARVDLAGDGVV